MNRAYHPVGVTSTAAHPRPGEVIEERLLTELKAAEAVFARAEEPEKEAAGERYRQILERFNEVILYPADAACSGGSPLALPLFGNRALRQLTE